ncbi:MAG: response regulator [Desulfobacterales bacterium]|nr:response regulator [Desulfobacterales bacterium]
MSKILVIDDEDSIRKLLSISLIYKGYEVVTAEDGEEGIEAFKKESPQIVLTDIKMPGMDGIEVLKRIRRLDPDARVIVITGHGDMKSAVEALQLEASDFINKPITDEALSVALKRAEEILWMKSKLRDYTSDLEAKIKEATDELRAAHDFQQNLIQNSIDGIIAADRHGSVIVFNQGAENLLGYSADEVIAKMQMDRIYPSGVAEMIKEELNGEAYGGKDRLVNYESVIISKNGEEIPVRISGAILFDNGATAGVVCFFQDLRQIKRLQKELIENERLSATGQAVAGMAHYVKNILNGLQGGVYIVNTGLRKNKSDVLRKGWGMVENNVAKISDLVTNMLIYSKDREPELAPCFPNDIAQEVCDLMQEKARQSKIELVRDLDPSINECFLDPNGIHRCLLNLVGNAIDSCVLDPEKDKTCSVAIGTRKEGDWIRFDISDNGAGMTKEVQEKLFDRFFSTKGPKGTGLGLLVTRKIVEEHGGSISYESDPGEGTTFTMRLPYRRSPEEA